MGVGVDVSAGLRAALCGRMRAPMMVVERSWVTDFKSITVVCASAPAVRAGGGLPSGAPPAGRWFTPPTIVLTLPPGKVTESGIAPKPNIIVVRRGK